jgi:hypothetical protein
MAIGPLVCDSRNITKKKEIEKIMQCPSIKSPFWYDSGFFLKGRYYYVFITKKMPKKHFLNGISSKSLKFLKIWLMYINIIHHKKFTQEFHQQPYFLSTYSNFQTLWRVLFG